MKKICQLLFRLFISATCLFGETRSLTCRQPLEAVKGVLIELLCKSDIPIDSCTFNFPGFKKIKVYAGIKNQNYEFVGNYKKGECGIRFSAMKQELEGHVDVEVTFPDEDVPAQAKINVTMLYPPYDIHVVNNRKKFEFNEGDKMTFNCSCSKSNPLPNISLRIDKPMTISESIHEVGTNIEIKVTISAYPEPQLYRWRRNNGNYLTLGNSWLLPVKDTRRYWEVGVNVSEITFDDLVYGFELTIGNSEGTYTKKVILRAKKDKILFTRVINRLLFAFTTILIMCLPAFYIIRRGSVKST